MFFFFGFYKIIKPLNISSRHIAFGYESITENIELFSWNSSVYKKKL